MSPQTYGVMVNRDQAERHIRAVGTPLSADQMHYAYLGYLAGLKAERERCAKIAESMDDGTLSLASDYEYGIKRALGEVSIRIRGGQ